MSGLSNLIVSLVPRPNPLQPLEANRRANRPLSLGMLVRVDPDLPRWHFDLERLELKLLLLKLLLQLLSLLISLLIS